MNKEEKLRNFRSVDMWYLDEPAGSDKACRVFREYSALAAPLAAELESEREKETSTDEKKKSKEKKKGSEGDDDEDEEEEDEEEEK